VTLITPNPSKLEQLFVKSFCDTDYFDTRMVYTSMA